jgi:hypothetical protein
MTIEEMRQELHEFCQEQYECQVCDLGGDTCRCGRGAYFIDFEPGEDGYMSSEEIALAYLNAFGKISTPTAEEPHIKDSGSRTEFSTGAVRDIQKGKGRCDLMPLDVVARVLGNHDDPDHVLMGIATFMGTGQTGHLYYALEMFRNLWGIPTETMLLEVAKHFEEGAEKYGEGNWQKGLPVKCYINSAVRHYLKYLRGDTDEPHDRAFCWNLMCAIWTCDHKPELNEYGLKTCSVCGETLPREAKFCGNCQVSMVDPDDLMGEYEEENE